MAETSHPRIGDRLLGSLVVEETYDADRPRELVLERAASALVAAGADRVRYYQPASGSIPGLPSDKFWFLAWFWGEHEADVYVGLPIRFEDASISKSLQRHSLEPVQASGEKCPADWVDLLGLREKRWVDVLIHKSGQPIGLLSFDWKGSEIPFDQEVLDRLVIFGAVLGYQLSATEPLMSGRIQQDLDDLFRSPSSSAKSPQNLAREALTVLQKDGEIASLSLFRYDWTRDELSRRELLLFDKPDPVAEQEVFETRRYLTGMAWKHEEYRLVRSFAELESNAPELVSNWSRSFHESMVGPLQSVMYERVGLRDQVWLIRAINDAKNPRLPFISKRDLLQAFCRNLSPIMDAESATKRSDAVAELQRKISENRALDVIMGVAEKRLQQLESVRRLMVVVIHMGVGLTQVPPFVWGDKGRLKSVRDFDQLVVHPTLRQLANDPRPLVLRRQDSGILGQAAGLTSTEGADLLLVPARSSEFLGVLAIPVWRHSTQRMKDGEFWSEPSEEFVTQVARLATSAVERSQATQLARNALRALSLVGHEMTEPLATVLGLSRHALATVKHASAEGTAVDVARVADWQSRLEPPADSVNAAVKLGRLVGRQHAGRLEGVRREWSAYKLLLQAGDRIDYERDAVRSLIQPREGIEFTETTGDLGAVVACDSGLLRAALENLLRNAVKYSVSLSGGGQVDTAIRLLSDVSGGRFLEFDVTNVGFEIPPRFQGSIFDPFTRYVDEGNEAARRGMGLGLFLVRQVARGHRGSVRLSSHDFLGVNSNQTKCFRTTFTLRIRADLSIGTYKEELRG